MIFTRRIGKILRGRATPFQIMLSGVLAGALAFQPGWAHAPGLFLGPILLLVVLNGSLPFAAFVWAPAKLLSLAIMGLTFSLGRFLIDGPTSALWTYLINAPVLAWFGFENYVASGGLIMGGTVGLVLGGLFGWLLVALRRKFAALEEGSERYQQLTQKAWVKVLVFLFVGGGRGKKSWSELAEQRVGNPVRILGILIALAITIGIYFAQKRLASPILTRELRSTLELWNGATVDLAKVDLALEQGRVALSDLSLADKDQLDVNLFQSAALEADASTEDFLRKRLRIERLAISGAASGEKRSAPGRRIAPPPETPAPPPVEAGEKSLEDYLADYELWRARLSKARQWLEKLAKRKDSGQETPSTEEREESLRERLEREAKEMGWAAVRASHRVVGAPAILVSELAIDDFSMAAIPGEIFAVRAHDLSSDPELAGRSPRLDFASRSGNVRFAVDLNAESPEASAPGLLIEWKGIPAKVLTQQLKSDGKALLEGGTIDLRLAGGWAQGQVGFVDLPLEVKVSGSTLNLGDLGSAPIEHFSLPVHVRGPLDGLRIRVETEELAQALRAAGAQELERKLRAKVDELKGEVEARIDTEKQKLEEKAKSELEQQKDKLQEKVGEEAKGVLDDIFGKKKKKDG